MLTLQKNLQKNTLSFVTILRTPLNAIIGYSEILMEDYEDDLGGTHLEDFQQIINLARETETAIENL